MRIGLPALVGACLGAALLASCGGGGDAVDVPEPAVLASRDGRLEVTLRQQPSTVTVAGATFTSNVFNGQYVPPVLKLARGDRLELRLENRIDAAENAVDGPLETNLHYHGMAVTPVAPGDDVFLQVDAGADYVYRWDVPAKHPQGPHWYHPHAHGLVEQQILSGMSGLLVIDGLVAEHYPAFAGLAERHLLLKDIQLPGAADGSAKTKTVNGVLGGRLRLAPGELQVWHVGNVGADAYFDLALDGVRVWEIARDANLLPQPVERTTLFLPPGSRSTVIVLAPDAPGDYALRTRAVDTGPQGDPNPEVRLATVAVGGLPVDSAALRLRLGEPAVARDTPSAAQLKALPITRRRTVTFSESDDGNTFFVDGRVYDMARDDVVVRLGDVEEWTVRNVSGERHVFHIHQLDFLVESINNRDVDETGLRDVIDVPYQQDGVPGEVKLIIPFTDPAMVGRFVFHCHIVEHEDAGMMANVVVLAPGAPAPAPASMRTVGPDAAAVAAPATAAKRRVAARGGDRGVPTGARVASRTTFADRLQRWLGSDRPAVDSATLVAPVCRAPAETSARADDAPRDALREPSPRS